MYRALDTLLMVDNDKEQSALSNKEFELKIASHGKLPALSGLLVLLQQKLAILKYAHIDKLCSHKNPQEVLDCLSYLQENSIISNDDHEMATEYYEFAMKSSAFCELVDFLDKYSLLEEITTDFLEFEHQLKWDILTANSFKELEVLKDKVKNELEITPQEITLAQRSLTTTHNFICIFTDLLKYANLYNHDNLKKFSSHFILLLCGFYPLFTKNELFNQKKFNQKILDSIFNFCAQFQGDHQEFPTQFKSFVAQFNLCETRLPTLSRGLNKEHSNLKKPKPLSSSSLFNCSNSNSMQPKTSSSVNTSFAMTFSSGPSPAPSNTRYNYSSTLSTSSSLFKISASSAFSSRASTNTSISKAYS